MVLRRTSSGRRGKPAAFVATALLLVSATAVACVDDGLPLFACEAAHGSKFIELCGPSDFQEDGWLQYRFGRLAEDGTDIVELAYPERREGSLEKFRGAVYTAPNGFHTWSLRVDRGGFSYTVYTESRGSEEGAGVRVRNHRTGKVTTIECSERPRFYIFELQDVVACDDETPVGKACIE